MSSYHIRYGGSSEYWYKDSSCTLLHREDVPAIIAPDGYKAWYFNGQNHRENGPAVEYSDGAKLYIVHGLYHRIDGPAEDWVHPNQKF